MRIYCPKKRRFLLLAAAACIATTTVATLIAARQAVSISLPSTYFKILESARTQQYRPIVGNLRPNEIPWIFDGKYVASGVVIGAWGGDTEQNVKACEENWSKKSPYSVMCKHIKDIDIVAVKMAGMETQNIIFVPVERLAKLHREDAVVIQLGAMNGEGVVTKLPSLLNVKKWNSSPLIDAQD